MANLEKVIYINETDYSTLLNGGSITKGGTTYTYDSTALYVIKDVSAPEYAETAGYATTAGQATKAIQDGSGNVITATYDKKPLVIEVDDTDTTVPSGTYASITSALAAGRDVLLKVIATEDEDQIEYLRFVDDYNSQGWYYFGNRTYFAEITENERFSCDFVSANNHTHGNVTSDGELQTTDITIANGDKLVVTDASNSNKVARASLAFDGSTTTQALSKKGTWETFAKPTMVVTITRSGTYPNFIYTANKTYAEIGAALEAGTNVVLVQNNYYYWFYAKGSGSTPDLVFKSVSNADMQPVSDGSINYIQSYRITINSSNTLTFSSDIIDLTGKVDKVTSTDNAIARFNGTGGQIQNSGVTINDSNHVTAAKFITSGGTSSQFVKGDGSLDSVVIPQNLHVKLTSATSGGTITYSANYTYEQILTSINNGGTPDLEYDAYIYRFDSVVDTLIMFSKIDGTQVGEDNQDKLLEHIFCVESNNTWTKETREIITTASSSNFGLVKLTSSFRSTDDTLAATAHAVKLAYDHGGVQSVNGQTGAVTGLAPVASPALTGTPTAPTAASGTNTTQIATTAFVQDALSNMGAGGSEMVDVTITGTTSSASFSTNPYNAIKAVVDEGKIAVLNADVATLSTTGVLIPVYEYTYSLSGSDFTGYKGKIQNGNYEISVDVQSTSSATVTITDLREKEIFWVNCTFGNPPSLDKTYADISTAIGSGKEVILNVASGMLFLRYVHGGDPRDIYFTNIVVENGEAVVYTLSLTSQNVITVGTVSLGLPSVTSSDNGKVLKVVNGAWGVAEDTDTQQTLISMEISSGEEKSGSSCYFNDASGNELTHAQVAALIEDSTKDIVISHYISEDAGTAYFRMNGYFANIKGGTKSLSNGAKVYFTGFAQGDSKWYNITLTWNNNAFTAECVAVSGGGSGSGISFYYVDKTALPWVFYDIDNNIVDHSTILAALYENPASLIFATETDLGERVVCRYNSNDFGLGSYTGSSPYEPTMISIIEFGDRNDNLTCDYSEYTFAQSRSLTVTINGTIASPSFAANPYQDVYGLAHYGNLPVLNANINPLSMSGVQIPVYSYTYQVSGTNYTGYKGFVQKGNYEISVDIKESASTVTITSVGSNITVDTALSESSTNPVQNRVITAQILENEEIVATALNNLNDRVELKQDQLVSGTTIKTINNQSILGSGNISISGGGGGGGSGEENVIEVVKVNGTALTPDANKAVNIPLDSTPTANSGNAVTSGGIKSALDGKATIATFNVTSTTSGGVTTYDWGTTKFSDITNAINNCDDVIIDYSGAKFHHALTLSDGGTIHAFGQSGGLFSPMVSYLLLGDGDNDSIETTLTSRGVVNADWDEISSSSDAYIRNKPNLSTVATTGSYEDLIDKPTIPTALSDLTDDSTHRLVTDTEKSTWNGKYSKPSGGIPDTDLTTAVNVRLLAQLSSSSDDGKIMKYSYSAGSWQAVKPITIYTGSTAPSSGTGSNGDIYIQTS